MRMLLLGVGAFSLTILLAVVSGCGPSSDEPKLDRVPNVPAATGS